MQLNIRSIGTFGEYKISFNSNQSIMKIKFLFVAFLLLQLTSSAQNKDAAKYAAMVNTIGLKSHLTIIADDNMEGRETGTEGQRKAAAYIAKHFKSLGLKQVKSTENYQQMYPLKKDSVVSAKISINNNELMLEKDFLIPLSANETHQFTSSAIVFAGYGINDNDYNDYEHIDVKGKVVCFFSGEPKKNGNYFLSADGMSSPWSRNGVGKKLEAAAENGAVGAICIDLMQKSFSEQAIRRNKKTNVYYPSEESVVKTINFAYISHEMANILIGTDFESLLDGVRNNKFLNETTKEISAPVSYSFNKYTETINASNVLGIIEGTDKKDEYVFLTAHYDHLGMRDGKVYNGADDDGSGTVTVMQMATAFAKAKKEGKGPRRTIVFMTVSGEEKGLWGSEYYTDHPLLPLEKTSVDLNTDMIGRIDTERKTADTLNYVYVVGHDKISSELPIINEGMNNENTKLVLDYKFDDPKDPNRIYYRSDHYNFARKGIPVLFFYDGMLKSDYHKTTDDIEKINWPLFEKRAQMIFYTAWEMANRNEMLKRDKPLPEGSR